METTFVMLKPDAYEKKLYGTLLSIIEKANLDIIDMKMFKLSKNQINEHYSHLLEFDFFPELSRFMQSGPVLALMVKGKSAILKMRELIGPTKNAKELAPNSIRGLFADNTTRNIIHGSDSSDTAQKEIQRFFYS